MIAAHLTAALDKRHARFFGGGSRYARLRALPPMNVSSASNRFYLRRRSGPFSTPASLREAGGLMNHAVLRFRPGSDAIDMLLMPFLLLAIKNAA